MNHKVKKNYPHTLRTKLSLFYFGSLIILAIFFYAFVHIWTLPYSTNLFFILLVILAIAGFLIIYKITQSLTNLSSQIKLISSENLGTRIEGVSGSDEIAELACTFNNLLNRLDSAFKREQQFIADVAHELKTPLSVIQSSLEIALSKNRKNYEYRKLIEEVIKDAKRLSSILKNVLNLAWSETPSEQKKLTKFNLSELIEELSEIAQKMTIIKKLQLQKSIEKNIYIKGIKEKLARAILNIIDNAVKYTNNGSISITLKKVKEKAFIIIKDTGQGINHQDLPYIFNRFYRGKKTDKVFGSGLGLAIAKSMIALHEGTIEVESIVEKGTTFITAIPVLKSS